MHYESLHSYVIKIWRSFETLIGSLNLLSPSGLDELWVLYWSKRHGWFFYMYLICEFSFWFDLMMMRWFLIFSYVIRFLLYVWLNHSCWWFHLDSSMAHFSTDKKGVDIFLREKPLVIYYIVCFCEKPQIILNRWILLSAETIWLCWVLWQPRWLGCLCCIDYLRQNWNCLLVLEPIMVQM